MFSKIQNSMIVFEIYLVVFRILSYLGHFAENDGWEEDLIKFLEFYRFQIGESLDTTLKILDSFLNLKLEEILWRMENMIDKNSSLQNFRHFLIIRKKETYLTYIDQWNRLVTTQNKMYY